MDQNPYRPPESDLFGDVQKDGGGGGGGIDLGDNWDPIEALTLAWRLFTENLGLMIGVIGITAGTSLVLGLLGQGISMGLTLSGDETLARLAPILVMPLSLMQGLISFFLGLGATRIYLGVVRGQPVEFGMIFSGLPYLLPAFGAALLMGIGVTFGTLLLVVPGLILALGLMFNTFLVLDGQGAIDALSRSWELTDGHKVKLFIWALVLGGVSLVGGCVTCLFGLLLVAPIIGLSKAVIYQHLLNRAAT